MRNKIEDSRSKKSHFKIKPPTSNFLFHLQNAFFYLTILFLPTQFGKHFWPNFSFISGIRIDYLSPTIYLTDILILFLFVFFFASSLTDRFKIANSKKQKYIAKSKNILNLKCKSTVYYLLFTILFVGVAFSKNPMAGGYGILKFLEFVFLGFYTANKIKTIKEIEKISLVFSLGVIFEGSLAIFQFFSQSSLGGLFYFFGERTFSSQTPGIANASINGQLILRPYATFPHPNVLAGYLTIAMVIVISNIKYKISNTKKIISSTSLIIGSIALILTMSRVAIILWFLIIAYWLAIYVRQLFNKHKFAAAFVLFTIFYLLFSILLFPPLGARFGSIGLKDESFTKRQELISASMLMIKENPVFGVGVNNFLNNLPLYRQPKTSSLFDYFQPVHNIYLLIASQAGIVGLGFFVWFIVKTHKRINNQGPLIHNSKFIILSLVLILGVFDHYFLTLQQGQLLFSFVLGLCWARVKK